MMRVFLAALVATTPAAAQSTCGFGFPPAPETSVSIAPSPDPEVRADVTIHNRLAGCPLRPA
jgi:hypothetical protein